jgi:tRNA nucleotidyltransferase/poly(A) polymerase
VKPRETATEIVRTLRDAGHQAYFAGGCVRDALMGREPADYDVATSAKPDEIRALFPRTIPVGEAFGVVIVLVDEAPVEVATFRADGPYTDGRHPDRVEFTDVEGDVRRRDFTINGMMFDPVEDRVIDLVGGRKDIEAGVIRAIGDPRARFEEDRLRLVRAVRFAARFGFAIEPGTHAAAVALAPRVTSVSPERIAEELRIMLADRSRGAALRLLDELGLLAHILPEITAMKGVLQSAEWHPEGDVFEHTMCCLEKAGDARGELALAVLLHDVGKPRAQDGKGFAGHEKIGADMADAIARRLKLSNREREEAVWLVHNHMKFAVAREMKESTLRRLMSEPLFDDLAELHRIDALASAGDLKDYDFVMERRKVFLAEKPPAMPLVTGHDLIARGLAPSRAFAEILTEVYDAQIEGKLPDRAAALEFLDGVLARRKLTR